MLSITSPQNPRVKRIVKLSERRARDEARQTVVEGVREIRQALDHGVVPVEAYMCPELIDGAEAERVAQHLRATAATGIGPGSAAVFSGSRSNSMKKVEPTPGSLT